MDNISKRVLDFLRGPEDVTFMQRLRKSTLANGVLIIGLLYLFLLAIKLLGHSFQMFGSGFAEGMISATSDPFAGLIIGVVATSLIQSSSTTTSIVVGLVAANVLTLGNAIPIVMGANIGTTITNTLVSLGHVRRRVEFRRAFSAGVVHDYFNIMAVMVLFPLEMKFHMVARAATQLEHWFSGAGGMKLFNPLKFIINPAIKFLADLFSFVPYEHIFLMVLSFVLLIISLTSIVKVMRSLVFTQMEAIIHKYLFRNDVLGFVFGILLTILVQSSSVTTSLIIPLAGAGLVSVRQIFPYTLGSNIGTTVTAILAALATGSTVAVTVAFAHLCFNIFGIVIFYPLRAIPIGLAEWSGRAASRSTKNLLLIGMVYLMLFFLPIIFLIAN